MANYNHQPFEEWLLSEEPLAADETHQLQAHLATCEHCRSLVDALHQVEQKLRQAEVIQPLAGFVSRWQARLATDRLEQHRRQTLWIMIFSIGGAMGLLTMLVALVFPLLRTPAPILLAYAYDLTSYFAYASTIGEAIWTVLRTISRVLPPTQWAAILVAMASLAAVWVVAMQKLTIPRRVIA